MRARARPKATVSEGVEVSSSLGRCAGRATSPSVPFLKRFGAGMMACNEMEA